MDKDNKNEETITNEENITNEQQIQGSTPEQRSANNVAAKQRLTDKLNAQTAKIAELESKLAPAPIVLSEPVSADDRVALLEIKLAKKDAIVDYGLSKEDMSLITGNTSEEIDAQAKHLATRLGLIKALSDQSGDSTEKTDETENTSENISTNDDLDATANALNRNKVILPKYQGKEDTEKIINSLANAFKKQIGQ